MEDGGPSQTARRVAAHRLDFTRVPADYGDPAADEALAVDVAAGRQAPANRMHDYLAARTAFFDRAVTGALGRTVAQVVVGAAGYDGRAFRYAKPGVRWFEVDHPATQRDKFGRLKRLGIAASHVRFVEADFTRDPVAGRLRAAGLDAQAPGLFLLEGVAVYLEPAVLEDVLGQFRQVAAPGSRLAISVSLSRPPGDAGRARFQATVAALGEPARSTFEAAEAEALLARTGWQLAATGDGRQAAAGRDRLRAAGLLLASAGPAAPARPQPRPRQTPGHGASPPATAPRRRGWCRWPCGRTACGTSPPSPSPSATSKPAPAPGPTWTACAAGVTSPSTAPPGRFTTAAPAPAPCCARQRPACGRARSGGRCPP